MRLLGNKAEFFCRCWLSEMEDVRDIEIFHYGFSPLLREQRRSIEAWVEEHFESLNLFREFDLDETKRYQIIAKGVIEGEYDYWGEYDEYITFDDVKKLEISKEDIDTFNSSGGINPQPIPE